MKRYVILMTLSLLSTVSIANAMEEQENASSLKTPVKEEVFVASSKTRRTRAHSELRVSSESKSKPKPKVKKRHKSLDTIDGLGQGKKSDVPFLHGTELPDDAPRPVFQPMETIKEE